jgi:hypothetical protein
MSESGCSTVVRLLVLGKIPGTSNQIALDSEAPTPETIVRANHFGTSLLS